MSPVTKDNEILTSIPENATARPQPVALEVAVTVNGARTVAGSDKREPFSESTKTVLIFGQGAVVRLSSSVAPGQLLFLTNEKTKKEVVCQVVKSKNYGSMSGYVELEFTEPVSGFWGMRFPAVPQGHASEATPTSSPTARNFTGGSAVESKAPVTTAAIQPETKSTIPSSPRVSQSVPSGSPVSLSQPSAPQSSSPHSSPASLSATPSSPSSVASPDTLASKPIKTPAAAPLVTPKTSAPPSKSILDSDEIKIPSWLEPLARNAAAASAALPEIGAREAAEDFGDIPVLDDLAVTEITDTPQGVNRGVPASSFGTHFLAEEHDALSEEAATSGKSSKKFLIVAIAAGGLLLVGAGGWYLRQSSDNVTATSSAATSATVNKPGTATSNSGSNNERTQSQPQVRASTPEKPPAKFTAVSTPAAMEADASSGSKSTKFVDASRASLNANKNIATVDSAADVAATTDVATPPQPKKQNLGSVKLSAPVVNKSAGPVATEEALNLEPSQPAVGWAPGLVGSASRQPVAPSSAPDIKAATLISSVPPVYPAMAKTQRITGAVTIDALIDATGHVSSMTVVSGPALLQEAAKDALRHWKYESAQLHGKPVSMHMTVTIQFKLQ
ncbi:MAG TPA: energy transducer TonB [Candidatus Dormibacteraeota bacterium]|nr:energy transducer TonB [Candidatus Dormibacteraeota bacterium]